MTVSGEVEEVRSQIVEGSTMYYFKVSGQYYSISAAQWEEAIFLEEKISVTVTIEEGAKGAIIPAKKVSYN